MCVCAGVWVWANNGDRCVELKVSKQPFLVMVCVITSCWTSYVPVVRP